ncbi:hypothetical protein HMPREF0758_4497 [Serratia odorifera DSM 4582]|uniref:Uncharacterized protein n=2 Tax=Serratia odorifera TaxID=618 RepID=D4E8J7_SEROD|nr:hypothetical protein HMPREF0758_4497 [Serratia odorifera DSM 4582]
MSNVFLSSKQDWLEVYSKEDNSAGLKIMFDGIKNNFDIIKNPFKR